MVRGSHGELVEGSDWWLVVYCLPSGVGGWLGEVVDRRVAGRNRVSCGLRRHRDILLSGNQLSSWLRRHCDILLSGSQLSSWSRRHRDILLSGSELLRAVGYWRNVAEKCLQLCMLGIDVGVGCRWYWVERGVCG